jgi:hypothetical protein
VRLAWSWVATALGACLGSALVAAGIAVRVVRLTLSRSEIALVVCLKSASAAVVIAVSLPATRSVVDAVLGILVEQLVSLFESGGD